MNMLQTILWICLLPAVAVGQFAIWLLLWPLVPLRVIPAERLGWSPRTLPCSVWLHGASLGEWNALQPLVGRMVGVACAGTYMSRNAQRARVARDCADQALLPLDLWPAYVMRMWRWRPAVIVLAEVDLWPTWLILIRLYRLPIVWVNARLDRSMGKVLAVVRSFYRMVLGRARYIHAVDRPTADRLRAWKYTVDHEGLNLKWARHAMVAEPSPTPSRPELLLASIHADEELVIEAAVHWWQADPQNRQVVVAPRQLSELPLLQEFARSSGGQDWEFVDRYGVMDQYYRRASLVVVGGTFDNVGGHNPVEAAVYGATVICGPSIYGQIASVELLRRTGNLSEVPDAQSLRDVLLHTSMARCPTDQLRAVLEDTARLADEIAARVQSLCRYN